MSNWIQLTMGGGYDFNFKEIFGRFSMERDIAYSLAGINRCAGHGQVRWAVAVHSVAVARTIELLGGTLDQAAAGLMHDAHEAIIGDIPTPVARAIGLGQVEQLKDDAQLAIENTLRIPRTQRMLNNLAIIKDADLAALHVEKQLFMLPEGRSWGYRQPTAEWSQAMHDVITSLMSTGAHRDGGLAVFVSEYERLIQNRQGT